MTTYETTEWKLRVAGIAVDVASSIPADVRRELYASQSVGIDLSVPGFFRFQRYTMLHREPPSMRDIYCAWLEIQSQKAYKGEQRDILWWMMAVAVHMTRRLKKQRDDNRMAGNESRFEKLEDQCNALCGFSVGVDLNGRQMGKMQTLSALYGKGNPVYDYQTYAYNYMVQSVAPIAGFRTLQQQQAISRLQRQAMQQVVIADYADIEDKIAKVMKTYQFKPK